MKRWLYPGTFDPPTLGHLDLVRRARLLCDELLVAVSDNKLKRSAFTVHERRRMMEAMVGELAGVRVITFDTLLTEQMDKLGVNAVLRGVRAFSDFEYELVMALTNRKLLDRFETIFMMPSESYLYLSSTTVKEILGYGGDVSAFVAPPVLRILAELGPLSARLGGDAAKE